MADLRKKLPWDSDARFEKYLRDRLAGINVATVGHVEVENVRTLTSYRFSEKLRLDQEPWWWARMLGYSVVATGLGVIPLTMAQRGFEIDEHHSYTLPSDATAQITHIDLTTEKDVLVQEPIAHELTFSTHNPAGVTNASDEIARDVVTSIEMLRAVGATDLQLDIEGHSSDEFGPLATSLGIPNQKNLDFAQIRAYLQLARTAREADQRGVPLPPQTFSAFENMFTTSDLSTLDDFVIHHGYSSRQEIYDRYKAGDTNLPDPLTSWIDVKIDQARGTIITLSYTTVDNVHKKVPVVVGLDVPSFQPGPEKHEWVDKWFWFPIVIPPLKLEEEMREITEERTFRSLEPIEDRVLIQLYPSALKMDGKSVDEDSWRWTRKYQYLMKEDRIQFVYRFNYLDTQGDKRSLCVAFVDHTPTPLTLAHIGRTLELAAQARDGSISDKLKLITIFPTDNAKATGDPHKIGMGIDDQDGPDVLGTAWPMLGLVELHMGIDPTEEELRSFTGMDWTLSHEVVGHFTDLKDEEITLRPVPGMKYGYYANTPWNGTENDLRSTLRTERLSPEKGITYDVQTRGGELSPQGWNNDNDVHTNDLHVKEIPGHDDVESVHLNGFPTDYSLGRGELYPESAAAMVVGHIPFDQASGDHRVPEIVHRNLPGFLLDRRAQEMVNERLGGVVGAQGIQFFHTKESQEGGSHSMGPVESDREFARLVKDAKSRPMPRQLISILTPMRHRCPTPEVDTVINTTAAPSDIAPTAGNDSLTL